MTSKEVTKTGLALQKAATAYPVLTSGRRFSTMFKEMLQGEALSLSDLDRIKLPREGTKWQYMKGEEERADATLTGIIVSHNISRAWYNQPYDPNRIVPPTCSSKDGVTGVGKPGGACFGCPLNVYGTAQNGKGETTGGKACAEHRNIFLLLEGESLPRHIQLPPTSVTPAKRYLRGTLGTAGVLLANSVITTLGIEKKGQVNIATFKMAGRLDPETADQARQFGLYVRAAFNNATPEEVAGDGTIIEELPA